MPKLTGADKKARRVAAFQLFIQQCARPKQKGGLDLSDRRYDHGLQQRIKRMRPAQLAAELDDDEQGTSG